MALSPIDLVIPFVDGSRPGYQERHHQWAGEPPPCQLRSLGELRYALRSFSSNAPFLRRVFLVVQDPDHVPDWVHCHDADRLRVVCHDEFVPSHLLPTFQHLPLLAHLHRIEGLAERFLISNDDVFLGRRCQPQDFFLSAQQPRLGPLDSPIPRWLQRLKNDGFTRTLLSTVELLDTMNGGDLSRTHYLYPHIPLATTKSLWASLLEFAAPYPRVQENLRSRTRASQGALSWEDLYVNWLLTRWKWSNCKKAIYCLKGQLRRLSARLVQQLRSWDFKSGAGNPVGPGVVRGESGSLGFLAKTLRGEFTFPEWGMYPLFNDPRLTRRNLRNLECERPRFFCVNDEAYDAFQGYGRGWEVHPESLRLLDDCLQRLFPHPSPFERLSSAPLNSAKDEQSARSSE